MHIKKLIQIAMIALVLSSQQAIARNVTMVSVNWAPHYGSDLPENGLTTALVKAAFEAGGHNASIEFIPWERALKEVEQGKYDVVMGAYNNAERQIKYHMSDEIYKLELGIIARPGLDVASYKSLRELSPYSIGVSRGYANSEAFDAANYLNKEVATGPVLNIRKLYRGRIDMAVMNLDLFRYNAKKEGFCLTHVEFVRPVLGQNGLHIMSSRNISDGGKIIEDFNRGLQTIKDNGTFNQIVSRFRN
ncbi:MAG: transporter substrate-binding domain-containing protein [Pseudomonadota bacterium]